MSANDHHIIRVLLLLSGDRVGGAEQQALLLARYGMRYGMKCSLASILAPDAPILSQKSGSVLDKARQLGFDTSYLGSRHIISLLAMLRFVHLIHRMKFDVVYTYGLRADLIARPLARLAGCSGVISSIRGVENQRSKAGTLLDSWTSQFVDIWISNSDEGKQRFVERERLPQDKIVVIPNGIEQWEPVEYLPSQSPLRTMWGIPANAFVIGTVANFVPAKAHSDIIESMNRVVNYIPDAHFVFIGDGPLRPFLIQEAKNAGVIGHISFVGFSNNIRDTLGAIDIFLLASHHEGLPNALMEAMMARKPCIATDVGAVQKLLESCGLVIPPKQPDSIVRAICKLADDRSFAETLAYHARQRILSDYTPEKMTAAIRKAIDRVLL